jgi:hypothetical protein
MFFIFGSLIISSEYHCFRAVFHNLFFLPTAHPTLTMAHERTSQNDTWPQKIWILICIPLSYIEKIN